MTSMRIMFRRICLTASVMIGLTAPQHLAHSAQSPVVSTLSAITEGVSTPVRAASDPLGNIYVTDPRGGGVLKYNHAGRLLRKITASTPMGIAVASNGDLLVSQGNTIAVINPATETIASTFGTFTKANGIAVDSNGFIYVTDSLNNCVQVFNSSYAPSATGIAAPGKPQNSFGTKGTQNGQFLQPTGITYEKISNQLAVVDTLNGRVQFFSTAGVFQKIIGSFGAGPLKFTSPQAVAFEYTNNERTLSRIYVVDSFQSNVQVIDGATASFIRYIGSYGLTGGKLVTPGDVMLDRFDPLNKRLIITNGSGALTLFGIDEGVTAPTTGPSLTIDTVPLATNLSSLTITGTTDSGAAVTVNGAAATVVGTAWTGTVNLTIGFNLITVTAVNATGATVKTVTVNALPPAANPVALTINPLPAITRTAGISLSGSVTEGSTVTVNGTPAQVIGATWNLPATLVQGSNSFQIIASNSTLSDSIAAVNITLDSIPPLLTTFLPPNGSTVKSPVLSISGTVSDASSATVTVTVNATAQTVPVSDGTFSLSAVLAGGSNIVAVSATDAADNQSGFVSSTILYNPQVPLITLTTPSNAVAGSPVHTIAGTAPAGSSITVTDQTGKVLTVPLQGTTWTTDVALVQGMNFFSIKATTPDGSATIVDTVSYGQNLPQVAITNPTQDMATSASTFSLEGTAGSNSVVTATVNGIAIPVTMTGNGAFSVTLPTFTTAGSYAVSVSATDSLGNSATTTRSIIFDPVIPTIAVLSSTPPIVTTTGGVLFATDRNGPVGTVTVTGDSSSLDLTGVPYDPATLNIFSITSAGTSTRNGDMNIDGSVDITDALLALRILVGLEPAASFEQMLRGDVGPVQNHSPSVDARTRMSDVVVIMERVVGLPW